LGFDTQGVTKGVDAISMIIKKQPKLILLDYQLADMTCENVIKTLAKKELLPPFIIMTGHGNEKIAVEMMKFGAKDYMVKDNAFLDLLPSVVKRTIDHLNIKNELRNSEEKYQSLLENINVGVILINPNMEILAQNRKMKQWFPHIEETKNPKCYHSLKNPPQDKTCLDCPTQKAFKDGKIHETVNQTLINGSERHFHIVAIPIKDEEGNVIRVIEQIEDYSEKILARKEKENLEDQLRQAHKMEAIGTLAGGVAHDFNNILAVILGYAEIAMYDIPEFSPGRDEIGEIIKAGNRAKELVQHILSFSRKESQKRTLVNIHKIVDEALKLLRASIPATIEIRSKIDSACGNILAQPTQIHQVLMNICTNAAQAMDEEGGILEVSLHRCKLSEKGVTNGVKPGDYIQLTIKDTGTGFDQEVLNRIFDPYFTTKEVGKGSGMGLAVVHGIIKSHDGMIKVKSKPGDGTIFQVYFPRVEGQIQEEIKDTCPLPTGKENILVVDDEESIAALTKQRLQRLGYQVTAKTSSREALDLFHSRPHAFDLVISDQTMPELTGEKLAKKLIEIRADIPIIICTGYYLKKNREGTDFMGVNAFIMKPVTSKDLACTIRKVLDNS
jgi:two-component system cell cycle sensor histidine kinase/response regulator CckA